MNRVKELRTEVDGLKNKIEAIKAKVTEEKREMTSDEIKDTNEVLDRIEKVESEIRLEERLATFTSAPVKPEVETRKEMTSRITVESKDKFKSLGEQLVAIHRAAMPGGMIDGRLLEQRAVLGANEGTPSEGGWLVQTDFANELWKRSYESDELYNRCDRVPVGPGKNGLTWNYINETSRATGSRYAGIQVYWKPEAGTPTAKKPEFGQKELKLKKLMGLCYATDELLSDAVALGSIITTGFISEFNFVRQDALIRGTGAGQPLGFTNAACFVSVDKETGQDADTLVPENIVKMWSRMYAKSRSNAIWLINQDVEPQLYLMSLPVGTGGVPLYMPQGGLSAAPYATLMGRPVLPLEQVATLGDANDIMLVDMSQYLVIDKGGVQSDTSIHVQFLTDETAFRFIMRIDGQPKWQSTLTPYKGASNTLSPFIGLAERA